MNYKNLFLAAVLCLVASIVILYLLYGPSNDIFIGIAGIAFTIGVGFLIYFLQSKTDQKVKNVVDRIDKQTEHIRSMTEEIKSYHDEIRNLNERITKGSLYTIHMRLESNMLSLTNVKRQVDEAKIGDKVIVLKEKIKYWNRFRDNETELHKELEFVRSKIGPELYNRISIAIGQLGAVGDLGNDVTADGPVTSSNWQKECDNVIKVYGVLLEDINNILTK